MTLTGQFWWSFQEVNHENVKYAVMEHINTPFPSVAGPCVLLGGSDELFCKKEAAAFRFIVRAFRHAVKTKIRASVNFVLGLPSN